MRKLLKTYKTLPWAPQGLEVWYGDNIPDLEVTSCCVFMTENQKLLLVNVIKRGWDLPGGHVENNEKPEESLEREIEEETGLSRNQYSKPEKVGYFIVKNNTEEKDTLMLVYKCNVLKTNTLKTNVEDEISDVEMFKLENLPEKTQELIWWSFIAHVFETGEKNEK